MCVFFEEKEVVAGGCRSAAVFVGCRRKREEEKERFGEVCDVVVDF